MSGPSSVRGWDTESLLAEAARACTEAFACAERMARAEVTGEAGNGAVVVVANCAGMVSEVRVAPGSCRYAGADRLGQQILTAVQLAERNAARLRDSIFDEVMFADAFGGTMQTHMPTTHPAPNQTYVAPTNPDLSNAYNAIWNEYLSLANDGSTTLGGWARALEVVANNYISQDNASAASMPKSGRAPMNSW